MLALTHNRTQTTNKRIHKKTVDDLFILDRNLISMYVHFILHVDKRIKYRLSFNSSPSYLLFEALFLLFIQNFRKQLCM